MNEFHLIREIIYKQEFLSCNRIQHHFQSWIQATSPQCITLHRTTHPLHWKYCSDISWRYAQRYFDFAVLSYSPCTNNERINYMHNEKPKDMHSSRKMNIIQSTDAYAIIQASNTANTNTSPLYCHRTRHGRL